MFKISKELLSVLLLILFTHPVMADDYYFPGEMALDGSEGDPRCWIRVPNQLSIDVRFPEPLNPNDPLSDWSQGTVGACAFTSFVNMQKRIAGVNDLKPFALKFRQCLIRERIPSTFHSAPKVLKGQMQKMIDCKVTAMQEAYGITVSLSGYVTDSNFGTHNDWMGFNDAEGPCEKMADADSAMIVTLNSKTQPPLGQITSPHASAVVSAYVVNGNCEVTVTDPNNASLNPKPTLTIDPNGQVTNCTPSSSCGSFPTGTPPADSSTVNAYITEKKQ